MARKDPDARVSELSAEAQALLARHRLEAAAQVLRISPPVRSCRQPVAMLAAAFLAGVIAGRYPAARRAMTRGALLALEGTGAAGLPALLARMVQR